MMQLKILRTCHPQVLKTSHLISGGPFPIRLCGGLTLVAVCLAGNGGGGHGECRGCGGYQPYKGYGAGFAQRLPAGPRPYPANLQGAPRRNRNACVSIPCTIYPAPHNIRLTVCIAYLFGIIVILSDYPHQC